MAGALSGCGDWKSDSVIVFLIVANGQLCDKIFEVIHGATRSRDYRISVHKCESVSDILRHEPHLHVDFVIIAFDGCISQLVNEAEKSLLKLDEFFVITGRVCLVNCYGAQNNMGLICHSANNLRDKYSLRLFSVNINKPTSLSSLGDKILNTAEALMGVYSGIPNLNMLTAL